MKVASGWAREYRSALLEYLRGSGEDGRTRAYELGRQAIAGSLSILDVTAVQHEILAELLGERPSAAGWQLDRITEFFVESLSPFEMTQRSYREANAKLLRWKQVFDRAGWGIVIASPDELRVEALNPAFARMHGYSVEEILGHSLLEFSDPEARGPLRSRLEKARELENLALESLHVRRGGTRFPVAIDATAIRDGDGSILYLAINVQDITDRKRYESALQKSTAETEAANRELEAFSYSIAHDLRAPLRAIDGYAHMLLEDHEGALDPEGLRKLKVVAERARFMGTLIDDLLEFSRIGRSDLEAGNVDMTRLVREVLQELLESCPGRRFDIQVGTLGEVWGDRRLLRQVLSNLLGNAIKYTGRRDVARIEVGAALGPRENTYWVKDNGAGFDMKFSGKLFGVFQRLHSPKEFEGTGVGLALVQRLVHRHGGRIRAEGAVDQGATFTFSLPRAAGTDPRT